MKRAALLLLAACLPATADGLIMEGGVSRNTYDGNMTAEPSYRLRLGYGDVYLWAGTEQPDVRILGQHMGTTTINSFGLGVRRKFDGLTVFIEGGYGDVDFRGIPYQQAEVNYTYLVNHHHNPGRPIPVACAGRGCFETEHSIDNAMMGRVGLEYDVMPHVKASASYRWMKADEYIAMWDAGRKAANAGWWEENQQRDFSAWEMGVWLVW